MTDIHAGTERKHFRPVRSSPALALVMTVGLLVACGQDSGTGASESTGDASPPAATGSPSAAPDTPTGTATDLDEVLLRALTQEHQAKATYDTIVTALGDVPPFSAVAPAQAQHIAELEGVARPHGVDLAGITPTASPTPATLAEACQAGVASEEATVALYSELLPQVAAYPDVEYVFTNLRSASQDNHLPAFERCA
jgi:hypothetical protein